MEINRANRSKSLSSTSDDAVEEASNRPGSAPAELRSGSLLVRHLPSAPGSTQEDAEDQRFFTTPIMQEFRARLPGLHNAFYQLTHPPARPPPAQIIYPPHSLPSRNRLVRPRIYLREARAAWLNITPARVNLPAEFQDTLGSWSRMFSLYTRPRFLSFLHPNDLMTIVRLLSGHNMLLYYDAVHDDGKSPSPRQRCVNGATAYLVNALTRTPREWASSDSTSSLQIHLEQRTGNSIDENDLHVLGDITACNAKQIIKELRELDDGSAMIDKLMIHIVASAAVLGSRSILANTIDEVLWESVKLISNELKSNLPVKKLSAAEIEKQFIATGAQLIVATLSRAKELLNRGDLNLDQVTIALGHTVGAIAAAIRNVTGEASVKNKLKRDVAKFFTKKGLQLVTRVVTAAVTMGASELAGIKAVASVVTNPLANLLVDLFVPERKLTNWHEQCNASVQRMRNQADILVVSSDTEEVEYARKLKVYIKAFDRSWTTVLTNNESVGSMERQVRRKQDAKNTDGMAQLIHRPKPK